MGHMGKRRFESEDYTNEHATVFARRYDEGKRNIKVNMVRKQITDIQGKRVLDIGSGIGYFSNLCGESGAIVIAVDHAVSMLTKARLRYGNKFSFVRCKTHPLPFDNDIFDIVLALDVIEHLYEVRQALAEIKRVIKQGGLLLVTTDNPCFNVGTFHFLVAKRLLSLLPSIIRSFSESLFRLILRRSSRYVTPQCTHVQEYSPPELIVLMRHAGFQLTYFDTFPNRSSYGIYGKLVEKVLSGRLKRYKWSSSLYIFKAE